MALAESSVVPGAQAVEHDTPLPRVFSLHLLGGLAAFLFVLELVTGSLLLIYYRPSAADAYHSVAVLTDEVRLGWLVRGVHAWGSDLLLVVVFLHLIRVYFARAYRGPRRWVWLTGLVLCVAMLSLAFTGGLLPWDQFAYWSVDAARTTILEMPFVGAFVLNLFWGGWELGQEVLLRFYAFHVGLVPLVAVVLLVVHSALLWWHGLQESADATARRPATGPATLFDFWLDAGTTFLLAYAVVASLAILVPVTLLDPANEIVPLINVQPRWYLLAARFLLRHLPGSLDALLVLGLFVLFVVIPWVDAEANQSRWARLVHTIGGLAFLAAWCVLAAWQYLS